MLANATVLLCPEQKLAAAGRVCRSDYDSAIVEEIIHNT